MGTRGPLADPARQRSAGSKLGSKALVAVDDGRLPVKPPKGLGEAGQATWKTMATLEWVNTSDGPALARLAQLEDERVRLCEALDAHGAVLAKPVTSARGDVVGEEVYANPALRELRRIDAQIIEVLKLFGAMPMARARLGLAVVSAAKDVTITELIMQRYRDAAKTANGDRVR